MLVKATLEDIEKYGGWVYELALDPTRSGYPTYADGIKTKEDFLADAERGVTKEASELLLFVLDGTVQGWMKYFWIPEDRYLQLCGCNIQHGTRQALAELLGWLKPRFDGYTLYFGFPGENAEAICFLRENGFQCIEEDWNHSLFFDRYAPRPEDGHTARITRENFDDFRAVYQTGPETYWNCDRIFETFEDWTIFVYYQETVPTAAVFLQGADGYAEIYGMEFADDVFQEEAYRALLTAALNACKQMGAAYMTYFCGEEERKILPEFGFDCVGQYVLYIKTLDKPYVV